MNGLPTKHPAPRRGARRKPSRWLAAALGALLVHALVAAGVLVIDQRWLASGGALVRAPRHLDWVAWLAPEGAGVAERAAQHPPAEPATKLASPRLAAPLSAAVTNPGAAGSVESLTEASAPSMQSAEEGIVVPASLANPHASEVSAAAAPPRLAGAGPAVTGSSEAPETVPMAVAMALLAASDHSVTKEPTREPIKEPTREPIKEPTREPTPLTHAKPDVSADPAEPGNLAGLFARLPRHSRHRYDVYLGDFSLGQRVATIDYVFENDSGHYHLQTQARATGLAALFYAGLLTQDSRGELGPTGLLPAQYSERRGERSPRSIRFDRTTGQAHADDGTVQTFSPEVQDQLSILWQLGARVRADQGHQALVHESRWSIARGRTLQSMRLRRLGEASLALPDGTVVQTIHLALLPANENESDRLDLWFEHAPNARWQPVRLKLAASKGLVIDQLLTAPLVNAPGAAAPQ